MAQGDVVPEETRATRDTRWAWGDALAVAVPGRTYRVHRILFSSVRDRCLELGWAEGARVTCVRAEPRSVTVEDEVGRTGCLPREYAWFVQVQRVGPADEPSGSRGAPPPGPRGPA